MLTVGTLPNSSHGTVRTGAVVSDHCAVVLIVSSSSFHRSPRVYLGHLTWGSSIPSFGFAVPLVMVLPTVCTDMFVPALGHTLGTFTSVPLVAQFVVPVP